MQARPPQRRILLDEPVTTLTDYAIAIAAGAFSVFLLAEAGERSVMLVSAGAFAVNAVAAALGGTSHGIGRRLSRERARAVWTSSLWCVQLSSLLLAGAVLIARLPPPGAAAAITVIAGKTLAVATRIALSPRFPHAAIDAATSLSVVALVEALAWLGGTSSSAPWMLAACTVTGAGVLIQRSGRGWGSRLTHNDLFHIAQLAATPLFYRGALLLDR